MRNVLAPMERRYSYNSRFIDLVRSQMGLVKVWLKDIISSGTPPWQKNQTRKPHNTLSTYSKIFMHEANLWMTQVFSPNWCLCTVCVAGLSRLRNPGTVWYAPAEAGQNNDSGSVSVPHRAGRRPDRALVESCSGKNVHSVRPGK